MSPQPSIPLTVAVDPDLAERTRMGADRHPANDDAKLVGDMLRGLQYRPSLWPYALAVLASAMYAGAIAGFAASEFATITPDLNGVLKAAIGACPFVLFFLLAAFARQLQRVRHSADAMAHVAVRLVSPADAAQDGIVSLSQTVRMEVASLGDGIERGILRIGDMELVASDLLRRLEQAYASADAKMHSLTRRLSNERESLEAYAERVGDTILNSRKQIDLDLKMAGDQISARVREAALEIMSGVEDHARAAIGEAENALETRAQELGLLLENYSASVRAAATQANDETEAMREKLFAQNAENARYLKDVLTASEREFTAMQEQVVESFATRYEGIAQAMAKSEQTFAGKATDLLSQLGQFNATAIARMVEASDEVRVAGDSITGALSGFEEKIASLSTGAKTNIEDLGASVQAGFETQIGQFDATIGRNISILTETLAAGVQNVNETLLAGLRDFSRVLSEARTEEQMQSAIADLSAALQAGLGDFRSEVTQASDALSELFESNGARVREDAAHASDVTVARIQDASERLAASVQDTGALIISDLGLLNRDLLKSVEEASLASAQAVHDASRQPLADIQRENQRTKDEAVNSLKKLSELNNVIRATIASAEKRIGSVSNSLVNQTEIFLKLVEGSRINPGANAEPALNETESSLASAPEPAVDPARLLQDILEGAPAPAANVEAPAAPLDPPFIWPEPDPEQAPELEAEPVRMRIDMGDLPDRNSPTWISSLLARASMMDEQASEPVTLQHVSDVVNVTQLREALAAYAHGHRVRLGEHVYQPNGLTIFRRIQSRYATEIGFRLPAEKRASAFKDALANHLRSSTDLSDWTDFIENNLAGLITAHAIGAIFADQR